jgi:hypothetical protein
MALKKKATLCIPVRKDRDYFRYMRFEKICKTTDENTVSQNMFMHGTNLILHYRKYRVFHIWTPMLSPDACL